METYVHKTIYYSTGVSISILDLPEFVSLHTVGNFGLKYGTLYNNNTETKMSSFWRNFHHWLHWKLSFWQLPVQPVMNISSKWRLFRFSEHNTPLHTRCERRILIYRCPSYQDIVYSAEMAKGETLNSFLFHPLLVQGTHETTRIHLNITLWIYAGVYICCYESHLIYLARYRTSY